MDGVGGNILSTFEGKSLAKRKAHFPSARLRPAGSLDSEGPCVTVLLCTLNGARFLTAQLASLEQQTYRNWRLVVSDDGSIDETVDILSEFAALIPNSVELRQGPRRGAAANFLALASDASIEGDYFAFCDQDDIWHPEKLKRALSWLREVGNDHAAVYSARTRLVDAQAKPFGYAPLFKKPPCFANALVQSVAGANTMLFNAATKQLFEQARPLEIVSHDWWAYQLVCGSNGIFQYDSQPCIDYRQHDRNQIGCNRGLRAQLKRLMMIFDGRFTRWNDINIAALESSNHLLSDEARSLLTLYSAIRAGSIIGRLATFIRSPIRRQTFISNIALVIAVALKKL